MSIWLAQAIVRDGEGATKFITLQIEGGASREVSQGRLCDRPLAAGEDGLLRLRSQPWASWPRSVLPTLDDLDVSQLRVWLASNGEEVLVAEKGGRAESYREEAGSRVMQAAEITVRVDLARGNAEMQGRTPAQAESRHGGDGGVAGRNWGWGHIHDARLHSYF